MSRALARAVLPYEAVSVAFFEGREYVRPAVSRRASERTIAPNVLSPIGARIRYSRRKDLRRRAGGDGGSARATAALDRERAGRPKHESLARDASAGPRQQENWARRGRSRPSQRNRKENILLSWGLGAPGGIFGPREMGSEEGRACGAAVAEAGGPLWGFRGELNPHRSRKVPFVPQLVLWSSSAQVRQGAGGKRYFLGVENQEVPRARAWLTDRVS
ncbi:hypothetical protein ACVWZ6_001466 [Bradyrhizobium sp. GM6.1]